PPPQPKGNLRAWIFGFICGGLIAGLLYVATHTAAGNSKIEKADPRLPAFWSGFIDKPDKPWVIFSNAEFVGKPRTGMRYFDPAVDSKDEILDHYTGVGEVLAVHELDRLFTSLNHGIRVKRGRLLSMDD